MGSRMGLAGLDLRLCTSTGQQCCSQLNEDELGMTLNNAIRYNHTLGIELRELETNARALNAALSCKFYSNLAIAIIYIL